MSTKVRGCLLLCYHFNVYGENKEMSLEPVIPEVLLRVGEKTSNITRKHRHIITARVEKCGYNP